VARRRGERVAPAFVLVELPGAALAGHQALRPEAHEQDENDPEHQQAQVLQEAQLLGQQVASRSADSRKVKESGAATLTTCASTVPAAPARVAPRAKASSFRRVVLMPVAAAASSSSRIATHARPIRDSDNRRKAVMTAATSRISSQ